MTGLTRHGAQRWGTTSTGGLGSSVAEARAAVEEGSAARLAGPRKKRGEGTAAVAARVGQRGRKREEASGPREELGQQARPGRRRREWPAGRIEEGRGGKSISFSFSK